MNILEFKLHIFTDALSKMPRLFLEHVFQGPVTVKEVTRKHEARHGCVCMGRGGITHEEGGGAEIVVSTEKQFISIFNIVPEDL